MDVFVHEISETHKVGSKNKYTANASHTHLFFIAWGGDSGVFPSDISGICSHLREKICQKTILDTAAKVGRKQRKKNL